MCPIPPEPKWQSRKTIAHNAKLFHTALVEYNIEPGRVDLRKIEGLHEVSLKMLRNAK